MGEQNRWRCEKCNTTNSLTIPRCSFCSFVRPGAIVPDRDRDKLTQRLHNTIEKLTPPQSRKMWQWLEDNIL